MDHGCNVMIVMMISMVAAASMVTAKTVDVGGDIGWSIPPTATTYADWASNHTFFLNDVLVFNFATGLHNVAEVTESAYKECDTGATIRLHSVAPVSITLDTPGQVFFFCSMPGHCSTGQKLAINVTGDPTSPAPTQSPSMTAGSTTSTPGSSYALIPNPLVVLMLITAAAMLIFI